MRSVASLVRRYPLATFFAIAYATSFIGGYLSERYPSDLWAVFVYGPLIGAFISQQTLIWSFGDSPVILGLRVDSSGRVKVRLSEQ